MNIEFLKRIISSIILIPLTFTIILNGGLIFNLFILILFLISIYEWNKIALNILSKFIGIFGLLISFYCFYKLRIISDSDFNYLIFVLTICIATDIGGYLFGKFFKGPKLTKISPNKTYSGVIGSYFFSVILTFIFLKVQDINIFDFSKIYLLFFTIMISTISQVGDIVISYFKRLSNLKDTGTLIPGHGGILDRIDGMIFAFPFSYFLIYLSLIY